MSRVSPTKGRGQSFPYTFLSDIWNGHGGDGGWTGCKAFNNPNSQCQYVIHNIKIYTVDGRPMFSGKCGALNGDAVELLYIPLSVFPTLYSVFSSCPASASSAF